MVRKVRHYLNNMTKSIEKNEERLRIISSTLEHSTSGNTLKRKPSPCSSLGGSLSSINALNSSNNLQNLSNGSSIGMVGSSTMAGISAGNGTLNNNQKNTIFGAHSPDAVKKLLALSETKVKTVKTSSSSTSMPLSHMGNNNSNNSRNLLNTSSHIANSNSSLTNNLNGVNSMTMGSISPATPLSPRTKSRSTSNSQPLNLTKFNNNANYNSSIPLSSESSSVSTIKLNDSTFSSTMLPSSNYNLNTNNHQTKKLNGTASIIVNNVNHSNVVVVGAASSSEADSGRASMASNVDQDQCSPTFQQRAFILNRCMN